MKLLGLITCILCVGSVNAQFVENNALYSTAEVGVGNYLAMDLSLNYVYKQTYTAKIGISGSIRKARSRPEDYTSGLTGILLLGLVSPYDEIQSYHIGIGKIYNLNSRGTTRLNMSVGTGYSVVTEPENWQKIDGNIFTENYTWNERKYGTIGFNINPKIEFPLAPYFGLTVSPLIHFNKDQIYYGIGMGSMIGVLKKKQV